MEKEPQSEANAGQIAPAVDSTKPSNSPEWWSYRENGLVCPYFTIYRGGVKLGSVASAKAAENIVNSANALLRLLCVQLANKPKWQKTSDGIPDQGLGNIVVVWVISERLRQPHVLDEWQDAIKYPERFPYWLPLPPLPESASKLPLETEGCSRSDKAVALSAEESDEPTADFGIDEP